jgi:hypothetical protein
VGWAHRRGTRLSGTRQRPSSASLLSPVPFNTAPILLMRSDESDPTRPSAVSVRENLLS